MLPCLIVYFVICFERETSFLSPHLLAGKGIHIENFMENIFDLCGSLDFGRNILVGLCTRNMHVTLERCCYHAQIGVNQIWKESLQ